jgi:hypothetical protein
MNKQSIFRVMALIVVMLAVSINLNAQTRTGATATDVKQTDVKVEDAKAAEAKLAEAKLEDAKLEDAKLEDTAVLTLKPEKLSLKVGEKQRIVIKEVRASKEVAAEVEKLIWKSSNEKVVSVDKEGNVVAISAGKATITASKGKAEGKCEVAVEKAVSKDKNAK